MHDVDNAYWAELPVRLPWNYKFRTALAPGMTLEVKGRRNGSRHRASLLAFAPWGACRRVWTARFRSEGPVSDEDLKCAAAGAFLSACGTDARLKDGLRYEAAKEGARKALGYLGHG